MKLLRETMKLTYMFYIDHSIPRSPDIYADPPDMHTHLQMEWKGNENEASCSMDIGREQVTPKSSGSVKHVVSSRSSKKKNCCW